MRKLPLFVASCVVPILLISGCGDKKITGQVFLKDGEKVTKLSDVELSFIESSKLFSSEPQFKERAIIALNDIKDRKSRLIARKAKFAVAEVAYLGVSEISKALKLDEKDNFNSLQRRMQSTRESIESMSRKLASEISSFKNGDHPSIYYLDNKDVIYKQARTDADGKFAVDISKQADKIVLAKSGSSYWMLRLPPEANQINLSDRNSHESGCKECLFSGENNKDIRDNLREFIAHQKVDFKSLADFEITPETPVADIPKNTSDLSCSIEIRNRAASLVKADAAYRSDIAVLGGLRTPQITAILNATNSKLNKDSNDLKALLPPCIDSIANYVNSNG